MIKKRLAQVYSLATVPLAGTATAYATELLNGSSLMAMVGGLAVATTAHFAGDHKIKYAGRMAFAAAVISGLVTEQQMSKTNFEASELNQNARIIMPADQPDTASTARKLHI